MPRWLSIASCLTVAGATAVLSSACGGEPETRYPGSLSTAYAGSRPVGRGPRFQPRPPDQAVPGCRRILGRRYGAHIELFAADRVVVVPAGIGTEPPRQRRIGRVVRARCYGPAVTLDPTGLILVRAGAHPRVGDLFANWGLPLTPGRMTAFRGRATAYVGGRLWHGDPRLIPLRRHATIVLEVGPYVPPHRRYVFPKGL